MTMTNTPQELRNIGYIAAICTDRAEQALTVAARFNAAEDAELRLLAAELQANADVFYTIAAHFNAQNTTRAKQPPMVERFEEMMRQKQSLAHGAAAAIKGSNGR
jgi:hypothetical protein